MAGSDLPKSDLPVIALVLSIVSWVLCGCLASLPAVAIARTALGKIERGEISPEGRGMAQAAFWVAVVNLGLYVLVGIGYGLVLIGVLLTAH
jgi:hypothetical protein